MQLAVPRETREGERRVALVPESVKKLVKAGVAVAVESGAGAGSFLDDEAYREAGATIAADPKASLGEADLVLMVSPPTLRGGGADPPGAMLLATLTPTRNLDVVRRLASGRSRPSPPTPSRASPGRRRWTRSPRWPASPATRP